MKRTNTRARTSNANTVGFMTYLTKPNYAALKRLAKTNQITLKTVVNELIAANKSKKINACRTTRTR